MTQQKKKDGKNQNVTISLTKQDLPLETLKQLIEENLLMDEIPFEILVDQYPSLLKEWYPGYPGAPRMMTTEDPICLLGYIKNGTVSFKEMPEIGNVPLDIDINASLEGEHNVWVKKEKDSWIMHVAVDV
ncbi:MAG TPA: hypothetical protein VLG49_01700 [Rhabdochlamydiaceae bacterium]|nr:hypothetical protein [Rhabdochlamydiaceae bacterium]